MAAVLSPSRPTGITVPPLPPQTQPRGASLRRNNSQQNLFIDTTPTKRPSISYQERKYSNSLSSSAPSSPRYTNNDLSNLPSFASTPASSICLQDPFFADREDEEEEEEDDLQFPSYTISPDNNNSPTPNNCSPASPTDSVDDGVFCQHHKTFHSIGDDLDIKDQPSRHVDYLSHNWREEDVWSSWRHIVGKRSKLENWERLENAAWRTWQKSRNNLPVVPPERLNWMKEHDVTWLYGPLQPGNMERFAETAPVSVTNLSRLGSFITKKSCLKKRSLSEAMLQRSISSSTLVQQAVDSLVSQNPRKSSIRPSLQSRIVSNSYKQTPLPSHTRLVDASSTPSSSGLQSPAQQRHIHFSEKVEQCIAINQETEEPEQIQYDPSESESEEDVLMMMISEKGRKKGLASRPTTPRPSFSGPEQGARTIAMLAPTTLRGHTPEPSGPIRPMLTKSSSQETLKPTNSNTNRLWDDADDAELSWSPSLASTTDNDFEDEDEEMQLKGLRRTPSGMFMPYDEDVDEFTSSGVLGRVIHTINTAKDIAHVVWNVGWRK